VTGTFDSETDAAAAAFARQAFENTQILDVPQFSRRDVLEITGLSEAQLKNTLDRDLVQLRSDHNPGTGRRRMFTGGDILKLAAAHTQSAIGFPLKWSWLVADDIERRAISLLMGMNQPNDFVIISYPMSNGDWARIAVSKDTEDVPALPVAYQVLEADRLITEVLAKLTALVAEQALPDFKVPEPTPAKSPYSPENDFFRMWDKDSEGRNVRVGLTHDETDEFEAILARKMADQEQQGDGRRYLELSEKHERARFERIEREMRAREEASQDERDEQQ
jgi:hypothetical protein